MRKTKTTLLITYFFFGLFLISPLMVRAEIIHDFDTQIKINQDASVLITETINYDFEEAERHGIYRYIPVKYKTTKGNKSIKLEVQNVLLDGNPEKYEINNGSDINIKIGKMDTLITGSHVYTIIYKVERVINYFEDLDELYLNITGNGWQVPIENVDVFVLLPQNDIKDVNISCYEGAFESTDKCSSSNSQGGLYTATSTKILQSGESLTIAIDFPKGIIYKPTKLENIINLLKDNFIMFLPLLVFIIMFFLWKNYGKDPKGYSTIIAQYEPPINIKPTLVGSLVDEKPDPRDITAGLIYLAEQGFLKIKKIEKDGIFSSTDYQLEIIKKDIESLEKTEKEILNLFFNNDLSVGSIRKISSLKESSSFSSGVKSLIGNIYKEMVDKGFFVKDPKKVKMFYFFISFIFIFLGLYISAFSFLWIISLIISGFIIMIFSFFMGKKTKLGADAKDHIKGFKLFLSVTEKDRLNFHNAPEKSPEKFMEFLPYAIALGVENKWASQFKDIYIEQPSWYQGGATEAFIAASFVSDIFGFSSSINDGLSSFSKNAANGGFAGSGGFSGGGFGGGGGGSW